MATPISFERPTAVGQELDSAIGRVTPTFPKIIAFRELCRCGEEVWIENDGQIYRLRRTRQGKLILTK